MARKIAIDEILKYLADPAIQASAPPGSVVLPAGEMVEDNGGYVWHYEPWPKDEESQAIAE